MHLQIGLFAYTQAAAGVCFFDAPALLRWRPFDDEEHQVTTFARIGAALLAAVVWGLVLLTADLPVLPVAGLATKHAP